MKTNRISFLVSLYVALFQMSGKRPPRGSLAHLIEDHFDDYQFQDILNSFFQKPSSAISMRGGGSASIEDCEFNNFDTILDLENTSSDNLKGENMSFKIRENEFENVETVFKGPSDADVEYVKNKHKNVVAVFDIYSTEVESILRQHGINEPLPSDVLLEAKEVIDQLSPHMKKEAIAPVMEEKKLGRWLNEAAITCSITGVNVTNIMLAIITCLVG